MNLDKIPTRKFQFIFRPANSDHGVAICVGLYQQRIRLSGIIVIRQYYTVIVSISVERRVPVLVIHKLGVNANIIAVGKSNHIGRLRHGFNNWVRKTQYCAGIFNTANDTSDRVVSVTSLAGLSRVYKQACVIC